MGHFCQDIVGRPVDNAPNRAYIVGCELVHHAADNWNPPADAGLKKQIGIVLSRQGHQLESRFSHDFFVGGDNVLTARQSLFNVILGRVGAAHYFNHYVDIGVGQDIFSVGREHSRREFNVSGK